MLSASDKLDYNLTTFQLSLNSNNGLVFTSIHATTEGSSDDNKNDDEKGDDTTTCSAGEKKDDDTCVPCPENTYGSDGVACEQCPDLSTSQTGSTAVTQCSCPENHWLKINVKKCRKCQDEKQSPIGSTKETDCISE